MIWFFPRFRYANRIIDQMGVPKVGNLRNELGVLIIDGMIRNEKMFKYATATKLNKQDAAIIIALSLFKNDTAVQALSERANVTEDDAFRALFGLHMAARRYAEIAGRGHVAMAAEAARR